MAEQSKRRNLRWNFREMAKLCKASDNDCSEWPFWNDLFKNCLASFVRDKVNDFTVHSSYAIIFPRIHWICCVVPKGPFIYYVSTWRGGGGSKNCPYCLFSVQKICLHRGGGGQKSPKLCLRNIWMVPKLLKVGTKCIISAKVRKSIKFEHKIRAKFGKYPELWASSFIKLILNTTSKKSWHKAEVWFWTFKLMMNFCTELTDNIINFIMYLTAVFFKLVQCQPRLNRKIQPIVVEGVHFNHS